MSLIITTFVPEGIVTASDSRQSITIEGKTPDGKDLPKVDTVNSDNVYKTFLLSKNNEEGRAIFDVGVSVFGQDLLGGIPTASHMKKFSEEELDKEDDVTTISEKIVKYFHKQFPTADTGFHIVGYKKKAGEASEPYVYSCHIAKKSIDRMNVKPDKTISYGASWSGQGDVLSGIMQPTLLPGPSGQVMSLNKAPIIWDAMTLQDATDFCVFGIRTTIDTIRFQARPKNVGGPIDVLVITPDGAKWIQRKELRIN